MIRFSEPCKIHAKHPRKSSSGAEIDAQQFARWEPTGARLCGQGSPTASPQVCIFKSCLADLMGNQCCPLTVQRASETRPAPALSTHSNAAALGHDQGRGLAAGLASVPSSATNFLLSRG